MDASFVNRVFAEAASKTLLAKADKEVEAEVAVSWLRKVLQSPNMMAIVFHVRIQPQQDKQGYRSKASSLPFL